MERGLRYFLILFLSLSASAWAKTIIISDLDDTIKQTNSDSGLDVLRNGVFTRKIFSGMDALLTSMEKYSDGLYILSASPTQIRGRVNSLLKKFNIKAEEVILRNYFSRESRFDYKLNAIKKIMDETDADVVLMGDDVGEDPEIYLEAKRLFGERVLAIYIHLVKNRPLPEEITPYISSFDIAFHEYRHKRMDFDGVVELAKLIEKSSMKDVVPYFTYCPKEVGFWTDFENPVLQIYLKRVSVKIIEYCQSQREKEFLDLNQNTMLQ